MRRRPPPAALVVTARRAAKIQSLHSYVTDGKKIIGFFTLVKVSLPLALLTFSVGPGLDPLAGDKGRDVLVGATSIDSIAGGEGATTSFCSGPQQSGGGNSDRITRFAGAGVVGGDTIDLSALEASASVGGNQAFAFIGTARFGAAGQVRYRQAGGETVIEANNRYNCVRAAFVQMSNPNRRRFHALIARRTRGARR
jgi:Ca2+-binding RTX toxin-like protein